MQENLSGKVIVITGATSGFGKGATLRFAELGASLVLAARRTDLLNELAEHCSSVGSLALAVTTDVSLKSDVEVLYNQAIEKFGRIDVWINNAGAAAMGNFIDVPLEDHLQVVMTDLVGTICGSYFALKQFIKQGDGTLVNVASMIGRIPAPYYASYAAAKHGVVGFSASLRQELAAQKIEGVHVCTVLPMAMDTPFFEHTANYSGHESAPIPPMDDAQKVIDTYVDLVFNPKPEVTVGKGSGIFSAAHRVAPAATEAMMGATTHDSQIEKAAQSPPTAGSLIDADPAGTGVKGIFPGAS